MSNKKRGLGKGLNELLSATLGTTFATTLPPADVQEAPEGRGALALRYLPVEKLSGGAFQPRQQIHHDGLEQLAESIRSQGILQPIVVRAKNEGYEIIAGERRWRAAQLAGLTTVPVVIRDIPDEAALAIALIENIQRENLNPLEEAVALKRLSEDLGLTHLQVAEAIGKSRASVTNALRLLTLNSDVQSLLEQGHIEMGHARALLGLKGTLQSEIAQAVFARGLSVRQTEQWISKLQEGEGASPEEHPVRSTRVVDPNIRRLEEDLADKLGAQVRIRHGSRGKGMVMIGYHDVDELEGILAHFK